METKQLTNNLQLRGFLFLDGLTRVILFLLILVSVLGFSQTSYERYENCRTTINKKYEKSQDGLTAKYYRIIKLSENGVSGAWECYTGERVCLKHNNNHCCICERAASNERERLHHEEDTELEKCQKNHEKEQEQEDKLAEEKKKQQQSFANNSASAQTTATNANQPVNLKSPTIQNKTVIATPQTQAVMDDLSRKLQNNQNTYNAIQGGLQQLGDMFSQSMNAKYDRELQNINSFFDKKETVGKAEYQYKREADSLYRIKNYNAAIEKYYTLAAISAEDKYNEVSLENIWGSKEFYKAIGTDYFPKSKEDDQIWATLPLPQELPDLFYLPTCHCYTEDKYRRKYDDAFILLRNSNKCKSINHQGKSFSVKYDKKTADHIDEAQAILALHQATESKQLNSVYDWLDYVNSFVWLGYLENKNAQTTDDLYNGLATLIGFFKSIQIGDSYVQGLDYSISNYLESSYTIISYYIVCYYYRINTELKSPKLSKKIAKNLNGMDLYPGYLLLADSKSVQVYSKKVAEMFNNPDFLLK